MLDMILRPDLVGRSFGGLPQINFHWEEVRGKQRLIGAPNNAMRRLHRAFGTYLQDLVHRADSGGYGVRKLPSATACVPESNHFQNAELHRYGQYLYITDLTDAYGTVSLPRLALLITFLIQFEEYVDRVSLAWFGQDDRREQLADDPCYGRVLGFLQAHFSGHAGQGLAIGGPLSPYLMNLYCEVYLDAPLRRFCEKREKGYQITYTRYVDDLVFSARTYIGPIARSRIRSIIEESGFTVNDRKSRIGILGMGQVSVTKMGLEAQGEEGSGQPARLVFPQKKRRRLHGLIHSYLSEKMDWPEKVQGHAAEFLQYAQRVHPRTATDEKTLALCRQFFAEWRKYGGPKWKRRRRKR